jgi:hypothetical protein
MGLFTARNRQNPFAERKRREAEQKAAEETAAILADPDAMEAIAEAEAESAKAAPYDTRTAESDDITDAPDVSTFATGGIVESSYPGPHGAEYLRPKALDFPPTEEQMQRADAVLTPMQDAAPEPEPIPPLPVELAPVISAETRAKVDAVLNHAIPAVADSAPVESEPAPEAVAAPAESEHKRGRGRPRPQETIDRDNAVHALLVGADPDTGISKESIAAELDEKEQQVYSSLRQLTKEGRAETRYVKPHGYRWFAV